MSDTPKPRRAPLTPEVRAKHRRRRLWVYGTLVGAFAAFWLWQPWAFDLFPRPAPDPLPKLDPDSAALFSPGARVLLVTAHPDDAEFYLGGLLLQLHAAGTVVQLVAMTDGDKGYYPFEDAQANRKVRRAEQTEATAHWSDLPPKFLGFADGRLRVGDAEIAALRAEIVAFKPTWVLGFDTLYPPRLSHGDHRRAGAITEEAVKGTGTRWLMRYSTRAPSYTVDVSDQWDGHQMLIAIHKSQFFGERLEGVKNMVASNLETAGERIDTTHGVGLRCTRL